MFDRDVTYPTAVASYDDEGVEAAIEWCTAHMTAEETLTVWTSQKSNLSNCPQLEQLVHRHANVEHATGRGGGQAPRRGPVLMAWADMDDIGKLVRSGSRNIMALCVITWNEDAIRPWVAAVGPAVLGDGSAWAAELSALDPVVVEALKGMTSLVNHNNTISAGFEKDAVVGPLLALHDAGVELDGAAIQGWALAHGWSGKNPQRLANYVEDIKNGKRPRSRSMISADYVDRLRQQAGTE